MPLSTNSLPFLDSVFLRTAIDYPAAVDALRAGYAGPFNVPPRLQMNAGAGPDAGRMWLMPAQAGGTLGANLSANLGSSLGVKIVAQFDGNAARGLDRVQGIYILMDGATGQPQALIDGRAITEIRTAAISALATTLLANPGPVTLAIFGTGTQARSHLVAMRALFEVRESLVCGPDAAKTAAFAEAHGCRPATAQECCEMRLLCACTTSRTPLWDGARLRPGTHINAVGNSRPDTRELDSATIVRARIAVDTREGALVEAGDLLLPIAAGEITAEHIVAELPELVRGEKTVRRSRDEITLFKSVGFALGDLVLARLAFQKWSGQTGTGQ